MTQIELNQLLEHLLKLPSETECVEFKEAKNNFDFDNLGKLFSALSNEANLRGRFESWIIFGVNNRHEIVGSNFRPDNRNLQHLKQEIAEKTNGMTFREIYELSRPEGRVLMFQVPPAAKGVPTSWNGHWYGRNGDSLAPLTLEKIEVIRNQMKSDWSAEICAGATLHDLDSAAIQKARENFKIKFPNHAHEVDKWDDLTFLNKAKVTKQGKITRAAILLLGKEESRHYISDFHLVSWFLKDAENTIRDYAHFDSPLLLASDKIYSKIRNSRYRYLPDATLFPNEVDQYEPFVIREALHNCIAHQDYELNGRINVVEFPDELLFTNVGGFLPQSVEKVIEQDAPPERYRNHFLATAMFNLNMIDTAGGGIRRMFIEQRKRFFPLPEYTLEPDRVEVRIFGKILDENFTRLLMRNSNLTLNDVILLDKIQKNKPIPDQDAKRLKASRLIEGRKPNYFVSSIVARLTSQKAAYTKNRAFDKQYYHDLIKNFISQHGEASRKEIDDLLMDKLPDFMTLKQKKTKINHLLTELSSEKKVIENVGTSLKKSKWKLTVSHPS